ncbi:IS1 family transposase [bacterium]|nr:MAG: IS1 family transposase [bacterium]
MTGSKKDTQLNNNQHPQRALSATLLPSQADDVLELDELRSYVNSKKQRIWIWVVLCRRTRQVVAWMWGDRNADTCHMLWAKLPLEYKHAFCYSDLLEAYQKVLDQKQHLPCTKKEGQTNHIERFNLTLRQRVSGFVRKTLAFSKNLFMHIVVLRIFLHDYNHTLIDHYPKYRHCSPRIYS